MPTYFPSPFAEIAEGLLFCVRARPRFCMSAPVYLGHLLKRAAHAILFGMLALMNFKHRGGWSFDILVEDQRTRLISDWAVGKRETLLSIIARQHGDVAEAKFVTGHENQGSVWIDISESQIAGLRTHKRRHSTVESSSKPGITCFPV
jgi:hypothetical protein